MLLFLWQQIINRDDASDKRIRVQDVTVIWNRGKAVTEFSESIRERGVVMVTR